MKEKHILQKTKLFDDLTTQEWNELIKTAEQREYKEGDVIFSQGDQSTELYVVIDGEVEIQISIAPQLAESTVYTAKTYDIFGEFAFVEPQPRSATARCTKESRLLMLRRDDFNELIKKFPDIGLNFYRNLARLLSERLRRMNNYLREIFIRSLGLEILT